MQIRNSSGFTFIEFLIVILIVSLLWFFLARKFTGHIQATKRITCRSNIRIIQGQLEIYEMRFGKYPADTSQEFNDFLNNKKIFVEKPTCPFDDIEGGVIFPYKIDQQTGIVLPHHHPREVLSREMSPLQRWIEKINKYRKRKLAKN